MMPCVDAVNTLTACFLAKLCSQAFSDAIHTADGRHNPYFVAHADVAISTLVGFERTILVGYAKFFVDRFVLVFQRTAEVGLQVVFVHPVACLHGLTGMTDRVAVFDDVVTLLNIFD